MGFNKSFSGGKNTTFEEMGTTRSGRLTTNSNEAVSSTSGKNITTNLVDRKKTSKKGLKLDISFFQFSFIHFNLFEEEYFTHILNDL